MSESANPLEPVAGEPPKKPESDLGVRALSAIVMIAVAGAAFWFDGWPLLIFVGLIGVGLLWEFWGLVRLLTQSLPKRVIWMLFGLIYIGLAILTALFLSSPFFGRTPILLVVGAVIATDVGAYFAGRSIGGPKIAPKISPSKTWAGLGGAMLASGIFLLSVASSGCAALDAPQPTFGQCLFDVMSATEILVTVGVGALIAVIAQIGDFFESWMKRRARVKDSSNLIPGHGGIFDRTDGLIAVLFVIGIIFFASNVIQG